MDVETEHEDIEVRDDTQGGTAEDPSSEDKSHITVNGADEEDVPAEVGLSGHEEEEQPVEAATSEPQGSGGAEAEPPGVDSSSTDVRVTEVNEQAASHDQSVLFEINSNDDDGPPRLHLDTPDRERTSDAEEEEEEEEAGEDRLTAASAENEDIMDKERVQLLQQLCEQRDEASQHSLQLQRKLAEYLCKKSRTDSQLQGGGGLESEQLHEYDKCMNVLTELKQQLTSDLGSAQQREDELRAQSQEKVDKVELEWREFVALKQHVAVSVLSHGLGKQAAQAKVESTLAEEQLWQDRLVQLRLKHIKLKMKIHRLEEELRDEEEHSRDPLQLQFEQLLAARLEQRRQAEKQSEESSKLQNKIRINLEVLSNVKEKLFWNQMQVQSKREQLSEVEATVARKRDLLTRTKQARNSLQKDNLRLKEGQGLLGNRVLLRDFENTVDASDQLEEHLENLRCRQAEITFSCGRWKKKLDTS